MNQNNHIEENLLLQYLLGKATEDERNAIETWLEESELNREMLDKLESLWVESGRLDPPPLAVDIDAAWGKISAGMEQSKPAGPDNRRISWYILSAAAVILLIAGIFWTIRMIMSRESAVEIVSNNEIVHDTLSDGTILTLNAGSKLTVLPDYGVEYRRVKLSGEAQFIVPPDRTKPFIVEATNAQVMVLGTVFNVSAYPEKGLTATVTHGRVMLFTVNAVTGDSSSVILGDGASAIVRTGSKTPELLQNMPADNLFWLDRTLDFNSVPLSSVFDILRKNYSIKITTTDSRILTCRLTASFTDDSPERIMSIIAESFGLELVINGNEFILKGDGCRY